MKYLLAFLLLIANVVHAAETPRSKDDAAWEACQRATMKSAETKRVENFAGRTAVVELVNKKCGYVPLVKRADGGLELAADDCQMLFDWNKNGDCNVGDTVSNDLATRSLDPRVFNREKFSNYCARHQTAGMANNYESFKKAICQVPSVRK